LTLSAKDAQLLAFQKLEGIQKKIFMFKPKIGNVFVPAGMKLLLLVGLLLSSFSLTQIIAAGGPNKSANSSVREKLWDRTERTSLPERGPRLLHPKKFLTYRLNQPALSQLMAQMPMEFTEAARRTKVIMEVPMPNGTFVRFRIEESPMMSPKVAAELPGVKTFRGKGIDDPTATARFDWTPAKGFHGYILGQAGTVYIDPYQENDRENYIVYYKSDYGSTESRFHCDVESFPSLIQGGHRPSPVAVDFTNGSDLRTYRLAIAASGEYTVFHGGQANALTAVMTAVNRLIGLYRRDAAISFTLVSGTNLLFPDPATDPYDNSGDGAQLKINQTTIDMTIGAANYDIGHLFNTAEGGVAQSPSVCSSQKAEGLSGQPMPTGDPFVVDYVAHEIGHQFSADHTYNDSGDGGCTTRAMNFAFEPGSGATILSYCGICTPRNLQGNSLDIFSNQSLGEIISFRNNADGGASCGTVTTPGNMPPVLGALGNFNIPRNTPFSLTGTATDPNDPANQLTYSWEENDLGPASGTMTTNDTDADGMARPILRVMQPTNTAGTRLFPSLPYILNNANVPPLTYNGTSPTGAICNNGDCVTGESLPSIARTMSFRLTVRDNNDGAGGAADGTSTVTVDGGSGPFQITAPNTGVTLTGGDQLTVTWDVANTSAAPVNAANVKITLSIDGGMTFPHVLAENVPNNGTAMVTVTNLPTTTGRVKVEAVGNIFFDISDANITITQGAGPTATPVPTPGATPSPTPCAGCTPSPTPTPPPGGTATPSPTPGGVTTTLGNISTRLRVETGDNVLIGGFIVTGTQSKKIIVRAIGSSLPIPDHLADPTLELRDSSGGLIAANNDWRSTQEQEIIDSTVPPTNDLESAIVATLPANNSAYTAIVRGASGTTGVALVEVYDLDRTVDSKLGNISTRGLVQTGSNVMIAGTIVVGQTPQRVIIRAIGPSLTVAGALQDTTLELRDASGTVLAMNDDWRETQEAEIIATGIAPTNDLESAIIATLPANNAAYTAILRGYQDMTGIAVVEMYALAPAP
jgi:hypothetical protein